MEIGEPSRPAKAKGAETKIEYGSIRVTVVDAHGGAPIEGAEVVAASQRKTTGADGKATFEKVRPGLHWAKATKAWPSEDHISFVVHYPRVTISHKALSEAMGQLAVVAGGTGELKFELKVWVPLQKIILYRNDIHPKGEDKYGHWWTVIDDFSSYGWWPKYGLGSAAASKSPPPEEPAELAADAGVADQIQHMASSALYRARRAVHDAWDHPLSRTIRGIEGELNGTTSFGGMLVRLGDPYDRDPHHLAGDSGENRFQPVLCDGRDQGKLKKDASAFALAYVGGWSWRFEGGNHCHTFQKRLLEHLLLKWFKQV